MPERRDIILAQVFFSDSPESKIRPAIVLSNETYHHSGFLLLASITTSNDDYCIALMEKDVSCKLAGGSAARFDGIIKLHQKYSIKKIGKVAPDFYNGFVNKIIGLLH